MQPCLSGLLLAGTAYVQASAWSNDWLLASLQPDVAARTKRNGRNGRSPLWRAGHQNLIASERRMPPNTLAQRW